MEMVMSGDPTRIGRVNPIAFTICGRGLVAMGAIVVLIIPLVQDKYEST